MPPRAFCLLQVVDGGVIGVAEVDPLKSDPVKVDLVQRRFLAVDAVQVADQTSQAATRLFLAEMPIQAGVMIPFPPLAAVSVYEKHAFAG